MNSSVIFERLVQFLKPYEGAMHVKTDTDATYYLEYPHVDKKPEMFAAVMVKKNYVSMYYMPVYSDPSLLSEISPALKKRMQGKSCFNFSDENDPSLEELHNLISRTAPKKD